VTTSEAYTVSIRCPDCIQLVGGAVGAKLLACPCGKVQVDLTPRKGSLEL
jgi:hypothetical protein